MCFGCVVGAPRGRNKRKRNGILTIIMVHFLIAIGCDSLNQESIKQILRFDWLPDWLAVFMHFFFFAF